MIGNMARTLFRAIAILSLTLLWGEAYAQEIDTYDADPPERAARLSYLSGDVVPAAGRRRRMGAGPAQPAADHRRQAVDRTRRPRRNLGRPGADVRLGSNTGFSFLNVDDDAIQMRITAGVMNVSVRSLAGNEQIEIDTPECRASRCCAPAVIASK